MHLVIDGYGGDYDSLANEELIYDFLADCPDRIGMTKIAPSPALHLSGPETRGLGPVRLRPDSREPHNRPHLS